MTRFLTALLLALAEALAAEDRKDRVQEAQARAAALSNWQPRILHLTASTTSTRSPSAAT